MYILILVFVVAFFATFAITPQFRQFFESIGVVGVDVQKKDKPKIAEMGGPCVITGFLSGVFLFVGLYFFYLKTTVSVALIDIFAVICTILIITLIGMFDDLGCLQYRKPEGKGFKKFKRIGLKQWQKPLLTLPAAVPLMAIMAGESYINLPLFGFIDVGIFYPLVLVPLAVMGASSATNMLAGKNGMEAGLGAVALISLGIYASLWNETGAAVIAFSLAGALLAFLRYNWYPAEIFPGDSLTYAIGAGIASVAIIGNMEKFALFIFIPWFVEFFMKLQSGFKAESFGHLQKDGTLKAPDKKLHSLNHLVMRFGNFREEQITTMLIIFEILICLAAFIIYLPGIYAL